MSVKDLKAANPLYPSIRRSEDKKGNTIFSTLVRRRFEGKYYLLPFMVKETKEVELAKVVHELHASIYKLLMLNPLDNTWTLDEDQINEVNRLKEL